MQCLNPMWCRLCVLVSITNPKPCLSALAQGGSCSLGSTHKPPQAPLASTDWVDLCLDGALSDLSLAHAARQCESSCTEDHSLRAGIVGPVPIASLSRVVPDIVGLTSDCRFEYFLVLCAAERHLSPCITPPAIAKCSDTTGPRATREA